MMRDSCNRLYVALSASQARRRLKGHGFGVRKVETAGRGEAAIVHTATGEHFRELCRLFADALPRESAERDVNREPQRTANSSPVEPDSC